MKSLLTASLALALVLGASCSGDHTGIPSKPPFDPIGTEPASGDGGAATGSGVLQWLCVRSCENVTSACPFGPPVDYCNQSCTNGNIFTFPGCEAETLAYYTCTATTMATCPFGYPQITGCDSAQRALNYCQSGITPPPLD
jgi:hypothetical protein